MKSQYQIESERAIGQLHENIEASAERAAEVIEFVAGLAAEPHELEVERLAVQEMLEASFAASWTEERQGIALITSFSEKTSATSGAEPNMLELRIDDLAFDPDPGVYRVQLLGAAIRELARFITGQNPDDRPTAEFIQATVDLTRHIRMRAEVGYIPSKYILDLEAAGFTPFGDYVTLATEADPGALFSCCLDDWSSRVTDVVEAQFIADGGPLALVDADVLRAELTPEENNAIGQLEVSGTDCSAEIQTILAGAAGRLVGVPR